VRVCERERGKGGGVGWGASKVVGSFNVALFPSSHEKHPVLSQRESV